MSVLEEMICVIAYPCAVENEEQIITTARHIKQQEPKC